MDIMSAKVIVSKMTDKDHESPTDEQRLARQIVNEFINYAFSRNMQKQEQMNP